MISTQGRWISSTGGDDALRGAARPIGVEKRTLPVELSVTISSAKPEGFVNRGNLSSAARAIPATALFLPASRGRLVA